MTITRRGVLGLAAAAFVMRRSLTVSAAEELKVPENTPTETFDFETKGTDGWTTVDGQWTVEDMAGAPSGKRVLVQRATKNEFNVIATNGELVATQSIRCPGPAGGSQEPGHRDYDQRSS